LGFSGWAFSFGLSWGPGSRTRFYRLCCLGSGRLKSPPEGGARRRIFDTCRRACRPDVDGIGPGDSYVGLWRMANNYRHRLQGIQNQLKINETLSLSKRRDLEKAERYYFEQIVGIYVKLLFHEKPKLQSIEVKGDPRNPLQMTVDLSGLRAPACRSCFGRLRTMKRMSRNWLAPVL
jgi:hypothetical protein